MVVSILEDIETLIQQAKEQRATAEKVALLEDPEIRELMDKGASGEKREVTAYERAAEIIIGGMHKVDEAKSVLQHANIPGKVLPPVLEILITTEAMITELMKMAGIEKLEPLTFKKGKDGADAPKTIDELTLEENIILVQEAIRIAEVIPLILTAKDGFRSLQSVENLRSLVTGESMLRANDAMNIGLGQSRGVLGTIKNLFAGNKKK